ncbi:BamA/TamA family outer membrane protein, partial [Burkholderia sp. SIMBA_013]
YKALIRGGDWTQSIISNTLNYNTLDDRNMPREGWQAALTNEFAGLGGDSEYYKIYAKARFYYTLSDEYDVIGSLTGQAGHV